MWPTTAALQSWPGASSSFSVPSSMSHLPRPPGGGFGFSASFRAPSLPPPSWPLLGTVAAAGSDNTVMPRVRSMSPPSTGKRTHSPGWIGPRSLSPMPRSSITPRLGSSRALAPPVIAPPLSASWSPHGSSRDLSVMRSASGTFGEPFQAASPAGSQSRTPLASPQSSVRDLLVVSPPGTSASLPPSPQLVPRQVGLRVSPEVCMRHPSRLRSPLPAPVATSAMWHVPGFLPPAGSQPATLSGALPEDVVAVLRAPAGAMLQRVPPALQQSYSPQMRANRRVRWADNTRADSPNQLRRGVGDSTGSTEPRTPVDIELLPERPRQSAGHIAKAAEDADSCRSSPAKTFLNASLQPQPQKLKVGSNTHVSSALGALSVVGAAGVAGGQRSSPSGSHRPTKDSEEASVTRRHRQAEAQPRNERRRSPSNSPEKNEVSEISLERARLEAERGELARMRAQLDHERQLFETTKSTSLTAKSGHSTSSAKVDSEDADGVIHLNVGGEASVDVQRSTLCVFEGSHLADLFNGSWETELPRDIQGRVFMDCKAATFLPLVEFLRQCRLERNLAAASNLSDDHVERWKVALPKFDDPEEAEAFMRTLRFFGLERFVSGGFASGSVRADTLAKHSSEEKRGKLGTVASGVKAPPPAPKAARRERVALAKTLEAKKPRSNNSPFGSRRPSPSPDTKGRNKFVTPERTPERRRPTPDRRGQPARSDVTPIPRRGMVH